MCLLLIALDAHPGYPLIVAANRDEFHQRPTARAAFWADDVGILGGRDLAKGGTWLGISRSGRFAAVTNYRELQLDKGSLESRGWLVSNFLRAAVAPRSYALDVSQRRNSYGGFNLIAGATDGLYYCSNRAPDAHPLERGIHGLSNGLLDMPWPKVERGKRMLRAALQETVVSPESLLGLLADRTQPPDWALPDTGVGPETERVLAPIFISGSTYGTRASAVLLVDQAGCVTFIERGFRASGETSYTQRFAFHLARISHHRS